MNTKFLGVISAGLFGFLLVNATRFEFAYADQAFPAKKSVAGKDLVLNGSGLRRATIFRIKVYRAALYLESKSQDPEAIINSAQTKQVVMHFVRDVGAEKLRTGWSEGIQKNWPKSDALKSFLDQFNEMMIDIEDDQEILITFSGAVVSVMINGVEKGKVESDQFAKALLSIWLGKHPPNEDLKTGLLGILG